MKTTHVATIDEPLPASQPERLAFFEPYLTLWVFLCMTADVALGGGRFQ